MDQEKLKELAQKEAEKRWNTLLNCLFGGTEHIQAGGEQQATEMIMNLIRMDYIKAENLLLKIGRELDTLIAKRNAH